TIEQVLAPVAHDVTQDHDNETEDAYRRLLGGEAHEHEQHATDPPGIAERHLALDRHRHAAQDFCQELIRVSTTQPRLRREYEPVRKDVGRHRLHVVGEHVITAAE